MQTMFKRIVAGGERPAASKISVPISDTPNSTTHADLRVHDSAFGHDFLRQVARSEGIGNEDDQGERESDADGRVHEYTRRAMWRVGECQGQGLEEKRGAHRDDTQVPAAGEFPADAALACQRMREQTQLIRHREAKHDPHPLASEREGASNKCLFEGGMHKSAREAALARVEASIGIEDLGFGRVPAVGLVPVSQHTN
eukprot:scaffold76206_cov52-Phaeocystis_antarctica.AAC.4